MEMPKNPKLWQVFVPITIAGALLYGSWKYMTNQSAKIRANRLETKVVQTDNSNNSKNIIYENKFNYNLK